MCDPLSIALGGAALGTQVLGNTLQNKALSDNAKANEKASRASYRDLIGDLTGRASEERAAAQLEVQQTRELSLVELGLAQASAADSNVAGASIDAASAMLQRKAHLARTTTEANLDATNRQLGRAARSGSAEALNRINSAPQGKSGTAIGLEALGLGINLAMPRLPKD